MAKQTKRKLLFITVFLLMLLISSSYATLVPSAKAAELTTQEKGLAISDNVVGLDLTKYAINTKEYPQDSYKGVLPQEEVLYELDSNESKLKMLYTFTNGKLRMIDVLEPEGSPHMTKSTTSVLDMAQSFLSNYQGYSVDSFYGELRLTLANVDVNKNLTTMVGNTKLEVTPYGARTTFKWTYSVNGVDAPDKFVALGYENGFLEFFVDNWDLYQIGSTSVNVSEEQAIDIAMARARTFSWKLGSDSDSFEVKNFNVTNAMLIETVFYSSLHANEARSQDLLMLYPMRHVWVSLDKFYPGNVYGMNVYVWADTGDICLIQPRISPMDPPADLVASIEDVLGSTPADQPIVDMTKANSESIPWIVLPAFAAVMLGTVPVWILLSRKKKVPGRRFAKIGGILLCLLVSSLLLVSIATVRASPPYGRAMVFGSESAGSYDSRISGNSRKPTWEVSQQQDTAAYIASKFDANGYNTSDYQGAKGSHKNRVLAKIADSEVYNNRVAVVVFDHGVGLSTYQLAPDEFHFMFEDQNGTRVGPYDNLTEAPENGVYDMDIYNKTTGKTVFAFINTCASAYIDSTIGDDPVNSTQGNVTVGARARGMPYAWTHRLVKPKTMQGFNIADHISDDGYHSNTRDDGPNVYLGFLMGSASLSQTVSGSGPYYYEWVEEFFYNALSHSYSVNDALDAASRELFQGDNFDESPLQNFTAIWPMYTEYPEDSGNYTWVNTQYSQANQDRLVVYGNGEIQLYQPQLTVNAIDQYNNPVFTSVSIDGYYMGTTGGTFGVIAGTHSVQVGAWASGYFSYFTIDYTGYYYNPVDVTLSSDKTITAHYISYGGGGGPPNTLQIIAGEGGTTDPQPGYHGYYCGYAYVSAIPDEGYEFDEWILDGQSYTQNPIAVLMNTDHTIGASFVPKVTLTISTGEEGTTDPWPGTYEDGEYHYSDLATVTAVPYEGSTFSYWLIDDDTLHPYTQNPISFGMYSNHTLEAHFDEEVPPWYYLVTVEAWDNIGSHVGTGVYIDYQFVGGSFQSYWVANGTHMIGVDEIGCNYYGPVFLVGYATVQLSITSDMTITRFYLMYY